MTFGLHADAAEHGKPGVAERGVLRGDDIMAELQAGATAGHEGGAVVEVVLGADITAVGEGDVVEEAHQQP